MISLLIWFVLLSSGSILCAVVWGKKYEEVLPLTSSGIVLFLFLLGVMGHLYVGAILVCAVGLGMVVFAGIWLFRKKRIKNFCKDFFTPAFWIFVFWFFAACYLNCGKLASSWDEFSHWADIVKVMTTLDDFGTNPESYSAFQSYPPAMSLFQYFLEKMYQWFGKGTFSEWRMYTAYQIFAFSYMMPFLNGLNKKRPFIAIAATFVFFLCPLVYYDAFYTQIYIDPFLGILSGTGLASIFVCKKRDIFQTLRILFTCAILVLSKDAGLLFAVIVGSVYVVDYCYEKWQIEKGKVWAKNLICIAGTALAVIIPKCLWNYHLKVSNAKIAFAGSVNVKELLLIICNRKIDYRREVWEEFYRALFTETVVIGNTGISMNYIVLFLGSILLLSGEILWYKKQDAAYAVRGKILIGSVCFQFIVYIVGLCVTYMYKFHEYEATRLASFERYMNIMYLSAWVVIIMLYVSGLQKYCKEENFMSLVLIGVMMLISPGEYIYAYVNREKVEESIQIRSSYEELAGIIQGCVSEKSRIYFISQGTTGFDYWVMRYSVRPNSFNSNFSWSIGEPFYEGDIWTREISAEQWQEELWAEYDYVALYRINDYFIQNFSYLFEEPEDIDENSVYKINKETKLLEKCGN